MSVPEHTRDWERRWLRASLQGAAVGMGLTTLAAMLGVLLDLDLDIREKTAGLFFVAHVYFVSKAQGPLLQEIWPDFSGMKWALRSTGAYAICYWGSLFLYGYFYVMELPWLEFIFSEGMQETLAWVLFGATSWFISATFRPHTRRWYLWFGAFLAELVVCSASMFIWGWLSLEFFPRELDDMHAPLTFLLTAVTALPVIFWITGRYVSIMSGAVNPQAMRLLLVDPQPLEPSEQKPSQTTWAWIKGAFRSARKTNWVQRGHDLMYAPAPEEIRAAWLRELDALPPVGKEAEEPMRSARWLLERLPDSFVEDLEGTRAVFELWPEGVLSLEWKSRADVVRASLCFTDSVCSGFWEDAADQVVQFRDASLEDVLRRLDGGASQSV